MLRVSLLTTAILVVIIDQWSKIAAVKHLATEFQGQFYPTRRVPVIPHCLDFMYAENTGGAFSLMNDKTWIITGIAAILTMALGIWAWTLRNRPFIVQLALGMVLGGAIGNLIDRARLQYVIDFIHAYVVIDKTEHAWPTFNIADMAIIGGIGTLLYLSFATKLLDAEPKVIDSEPAVQDPAAS